ADLIAADFRHHDIEQNHVGLRVGDRIERLLAVVDHLDLVALLSQIGVEELAVLMVVVGDQNLRRCLEFAAWHKPTHGRRPEPRLYGLTRLYGIQPKNSPACEPSAASAKVIWPWPPLTPLSSNRKSLHALPTFGSAACLRSGGARAFHRPGRG